MNENDRKVRKQWLILLVLSVLLANANSLLQMQYDPLYSTRDPSLDQLMSLVKYGIATFGLLSSLIFGWIAYRCAYKKPGTKLLTFFLLLTVSSIAITPILYLTGKMRPPVYIPYYGLYLLVTQGMGLLWLIASWKMRQINKKLQALSKQSS